VGDRTTATYTLAVALTVMSPGEGMEAGELLRTESGQETIRRTTTVTVEEIDRSVPSLIVVRSEDGTVVSFRVPEGYTLERVDVDDRIQVTFAIAGCYASTD
jgi:hypothetical protein